MEVMLLSFYLALIKLFNIKSCVVICTYQHNCMDLVVFLSTDVPVSYFHSESEFIKADNLTIIRPSIVLLPEGPDYNSVDIFEDHTLYFLPPLKSLPPVSLRLDSNVFLYDDNLNLLEAYSVKGGNNIMNKIGSLENGKLLVKDFFKWNRRTNLQGAVLVNTVINWLAVVRHNGTHLNGFLGDIMKYLEKSLNFTSNVISPQDNSNHKPKGKHVVNCHEFKFSVWYNED